MTIGSLAPFFSILGVQFALRDCFEKQRLARLGVQIALWDKTIIKEQVIIESSTTRPCIFKIKICTISNSLVYRDAAL